MTIEKLFNKYGHVEVFAVQNNALEEYHENGWREMPGSDIEKTIQRLGEFIPRYRAEIDRNFRQIIPYCIIKSEGKIFTTERLAGDERLIGKLSIGIGGHIEKADARGSSIIKDALYRELDEEVEIGGNIINIEMLGCICMDDSPVDRVHYGLAYSIVLDRARVDVKETQTLKGDWYTKEGLLRARDRLEDWSVYCVENFL